MEVLDQEVVRVVEPGYIILDMLTLDEAVDRYLGDLARRDYAASTLRSYRRILDMFIDSFPERMSVHEVKTDHCRKFLDGWVSKEQGTKATTEAPLFGLFKWLLLNDQIRSDPMGRVEHTRRKRPEDLNVKTVDSEGVKRMLEACRTPEEKLCLSVLIYTGARRKAASRILVSDYDARTKRIRLQEKGGKTRWKPVPDELVQTIDAALTNGDIQRDGYLIPNEGTRPAIAGERDDRFIWRIVVRVGRRVGLEVHTHALRAAFAVFCAENGISRESVQHALGHRNPATTEIYFRKLDREKQMEPIRTISWAGNDG